MEDNDLQFKEETSAEFENRLKSFEEESERVKEQKLKELEGKFPLQERLLALSAAKARDDSIKRINELEAEYGDIVDSKNIIFSLGDLLAKEFEPTQWLVEKLIPAKGMVAISGLPGTFKSWITQNLALALSTGTALFNKIPVNQTNVLIIDKENQLNLIQSRFKLMGGLEGLGIYFLKEEFFVEDEKLVRQICELIRSEKIGLIILDSLIRIYTNKDENSSNDMSQVFRQLRKFQEAGSAVLFVHHHRKQSIFAKNTQAEAMRGSSDILASVDSHLAVDVIDDCIRISQPKLRQDVAIKPFKIKLESSEANCEFTYIGEVDDDKEKLEEAKEDILQTLEEGEVSRSELIDRFKGVYGSKTVDAALKGFDAAIVSIRLGERGKKYYRKAGAEPEGSLFDSASQNGSVYI